MPLFLHKTFLLLKEVHIFLFLLLENALHLSSIIKSGLVELVKWRVYLMSEIIPLIVPLLELQLPLLDLIIDPLVMGYADLRLDLSIYPRSRVTIIKLIRRSSCS